MQEVVFGNAGTDGAPFRFWFVGDLETWSRQAGQPLPAENFGLRNTQAVEVKWGAHPAGEQRPGGWALPSDQVCLSLLVRGDFLLQLREPEGGEPTEYHLCQEGDYLLWQETLEHHWVALADSVILTIRWRS